MTSVIQTISAAVKAARFCWRHERLTLALAVGLLIVLPLLTGNGGGTFFLNPVSSTAQALVGLGIAAPVVRLIVRAANRRNAAPARNTGR